MMLELDFEEKKELNKDSPIGWWKFQIKSSETVRKTHILPQISLI